MARGASLRNLINCDGEQPSKRAACLGIVFAGEQDVEGLGQQRGKVVVLGVDVDPPAAAPLPPKRAGRIRPFRAVADRSSDDQGQLEPEPLQRRAPVFTLGAPLGRLGGDSRGSVRQDDGGLDLVSILPPWSATTRGSELALPGEHFGIEGGGMVASCAARVLFVAGGVHDVECSAAKAPREIVSYGEIICLEVYQSHRTWPHRSTAQLAGLFSCSDSRQAGTLGPATTGPTEATCYTVGPRIAS